MYKLVWSLVTVAFCSTSLGDALTPDCNRAAFSCAASKNPCGDNPQQNCVPNQTKYPTASTNSYVDCDGGCSIERCPRGDMFSDGECVDKNTENVEWGVSVRSDETDAKLLSDEERCGGSDGFVLNDDGSARKYNCRRHNPCRESRCSPGLDYYPGRNDNTYVHCNPEDTTWRCTELRCPEDTLYDVSLQGCQ